MATCTAKLDLTALDDRVLELYQALMKASTDKDSIYLKAKETLQAILYDAELDAREKANILSQTIASMVNGMSAQSLQAAIDLAKDDRDAEYVLSKLCSEIGLIDQQKLKLIADTANVEEDTKLKIAQNWRMQAELHRDYGIIPDNLDFAHEVLDNIDYDETYGTKYESIRLAQANVYTGYAQAYRQYGLVDVNVDTAGLLANTTTADTDGLVYWQTRVAERNEEGFDDNMRQHVANSSATMISMLLSSEQSGIDYSPYLSNWSNAITYLNTTKNQTAGAVLITVFASLSIGTGRTVTGTTSNIPAGSSVTVYATSTLAGNTVTSAVAVGIVQLDGTWSAVLAPEALNELEITTDGMIYARVMDSTGILRTDSDTIEIVA